MSDQESSKGREMNSTRTRALLVLSAIAALCVSAGITQPAGAADNTASSSSYASFSEAEPGVAPAEAEGTSVYLDMAGNVLPVDSLGNPIDQPAGDPAATSSESQAQTAAIGPCTPYSGRDNPPPFVDRLCCIWSRVVGQGRLLEQSRQRIQLPVRVVHGQHLAPEGLFQHPRASPGWR